MYLHLVSVSTLLLRELRHLRAKWRPLSEAVASKVSREFADCSEAVRPSA
jgi:hypothetical protein